MCLSIPVRARDEGRAQGTGGEESGRKNRTEAGSDFLQEKW